MTAENFIFIEIEFFNEWNEKKFWWMICTNDQMPRAEMWKEFFGKECGRIKSVCNGLHFQDDKEFPLN